MDAGLITPVPLALSAIGLALGVLVSWALLLWLYLRKPRRHRVIVPFLGLWDGLVEGSPARATSFARIARLWRSAARSLALACALLITLLCLLALAEPRQGLLAGSARSTLILLDASLSMQATDDAPTRFARAQRMAADLIDARAGRDAILLAQQDSALSPLASWSRDRAHLHAALDRARAGSTASGLSAATSFVLDALRGRANPELIWISDGVSGASAGALASLRSAGIAVRQLAVGRSERNVGIRRFAVTARRWDAQRCEALLELENTDRVAHTVELTIFEADEPIDVQRLELAAHGSATRFVPLGASGPRFRAQIAPVRGPPDDQPADDRAYAVVAPPTPRRVLHVGPPDRYLDAALALEPWLLVERSAPADFRSAGEHDLVIFHGFVPPRLPGVPALFLGPPTGGSAGLFETAGSIARPFVDEIERDDPLLRDVSLRDVNVRTAARVVLEAGDRAVARARQGPLIVKGERAGAPFVALTFDPRDSDLPLRVAWPLLLSRAIEQLAPSTPARELSLVVGQRATLALPGMRANEPVQLRGPHGELRELEPIRGELLVEARRPGFYTVQQAERSLLLAANLDPSSSLSITPRSRPAPSSEPANTEGTAIPGEPWSWLLAAALALLCLQWLAIERRWAR
jgi:hypothetical protein